MKTKSLLSRRLSTVFGALALVNILSMAVVPLHAEDTAPATNTTVTAATATADTSEMDKAWKETRAAFQPPMPPAAWQEKEPSQAEVAQFYTTALLHGADKAKEFYTRFPDSPKAKDARKEEVDLLTVLAKQYHDTTQADRLSALESVVLKDPGATEDDKLRVRIAAIQRLVNGLPGTKDDVEKSILQLQTDFPKRVETYQSMMFLLEQSEGDKAKSIAQKIIDGEAPDQFKDAARGVLKKMDALGKPLNIQFAAVDGRDVDVTKMKGKVVLIDFWATWCGPCMAELPNVKATYDKLHDKGFEIVGISFDQDKDALNKVVKEREMAWPQFFDGVGFQNKFGQEFGIQAIPIMWLVDKKGNLRDVEARGGLEEKVTKLLSE